MKRRNFLKSIAAVAAAPAALLVPGGPAKAVKSPMVIYLGGVTWVDKQYTENAISSSFVKQYRREFIANFESHQALLREMGIIARDGRARSCRNAR